MIGPAVRAGGDGDDSLARAPGSGPVLRAALSEAGRASLVALRGLVRPPRLSSRPDRLLLAPRDLRTGDPAVAEAVAAGQFALAGQIVPTGGRSPFALAPPSDAWAAELYGFGWLRDLRAADTPLANELARTLVRDGLRLGRRGFARGPGRRTDVVARRAISLLTHSPLVLSGAGHDLYVSYLGAVGRAAGALRRDMIARPAPADRLAAAIGLCFAGLCCEGLERSLRRAARTLAAELDRQILPDGGHVGRNPGTLAELLLDLLPLRLLFASRGLDTPPALDRAIDRMLPMLRFFRHGSGDLALFNGMGRTPLGDLAAVLANDRVGRDPILHAAASGYHRLAAGGALAIVDSGAPPPLPASDRAHAGCLSFEFSSGLDRIVVNGGAPPANSPDRDAARQTAAHSTLLLAGASSASFLEHEPRERQGWAANFLRRRLGPILVEGPRRVTAEQVADEARGILLDARHDGYERAFGVVHGRRLRLAADGATLEGIDVLKSAAAAGRPGGPLAAALRFHLHPAVAATSREDGAVRLQLPGGERWTFAATGGRPSLESSCSFAVPEGRRPAQQIVVAIALAAGAPEASVGWRFRRDRPEAG